MNDEASRIYGYTFISNANAEFFQQKFTLSQAARADANPQSSLFKANLCLFMSSKKAFLSYLMIVKCASAIWLCPFRLYRSLTCPAH